MENKSDFSIYNKDLFKNIEIYLKNNEKNIILNKIEIIQKSNRKRILLHMTCSCGAYFKKTFDDVRRKDRNVLCNKCSARKRAEKRKKNKSDMFLFIENKGYQIIDKSKHYLRNEYIEVIDKNGYRGFIKYGKLRQGSKMSIFDMNVNEKNYLYNIDIYSKHHNLGVEAISFSKDDKWTRQGILLKCSCGNTFETSISSFQNGKTRCDECSKSISRYEKNIMEFLDGEGIAYIRQYKFNDCRNVLPLPFDFYLKEYNSLLEVDGEGHFHVCHFNGICREKAEKTFLLTQQNDNIKNEYCKRKNIPLLRISYNDINNGDYKDKILQFIKK